MHHHYYAAPNIYAPYSSCFMVKEPWSALTHFIGFLYTIILTPILLIHASANGASLAAMISLSIFMFGMLLMFGASATYHTFLVDPVKEKLLKKIDHSMIFLQIAGSYTPPCICVLEPKYGLPLLILVWGIALIGIVFKICWVTCPKWLSSVIYIAMGWSCILAMPQLYLHLHGLGFNLLLIGGLFYTIGGVIYAMKLKKLNELCPNFGSHEIFHVAVMIGSLFHFAFMYLFIF